MFEIVTAGLVVTEIVQDFPELPVPTLKLAVLLASPTEKSKVCLPEKGFFVVQDTLTVAENFKQPLVRAIVTSTSPVAC